MVKLIPGEFPFFHSVISLTRVVGCSNFSSFFFIYWKYLLLCILPVYYIIPWFNWDETFHTFSLFILFCPVLSTYTVFVPLKTFFLYLSKNERFFFSNKHYLSLLIVSWWYMNFRILFSWTKSAKIRLIKRLCTIILVVFDKYIFSCFFFPLLIISILKFFFVSCHKRFLSMLCFGKFIYLFYFSPVFLDFFLFKFLYLYDLCPYWKVY